MKKVGMRTIKTGIGVFLCALIGPYLVQTPQSSAVACLLSMQDTVSGSLKTGLSRIQGTILGGIIGFIILLFFPGNALWCGIGVMFIIYFCDILKLNKAISIACVTFLSIQLGFADSTPALVYSFHRVLDTCVGVIIALGINFGLARPDYLNALYESFNNIYNNIDTFLKYKALGEKDKFKAEKLVESMNEMESLYIKLIGEIGYHKGHIDIKRIEHIVNICREANFHIQSIELLEKKLYLNNESFEKLISIYNEKEIIYELSESKSPVFNYHLIKVMEHSKTLGKEISSHSKINKNKFLNRLDKND